VGCAKIRFVFDGRKGRATGFVGVVSGTGGRRAQAGRGTNADRAGRRQHRGRKLGTRGRVGG